MFTLYFIRPVPAIVDHILSTVAMTTVSALAGALYLLRLSLRFIKVFPAPSSPSLSKQTTSEEPELPIKEDPLRQSRGKGALFCGVFSLCGGGSHESSDESALPFLLMLRSVHPVIPYQPDKVPLLLTGPRTQAKNSQQGGRGRFRNIRTLFFNHNQEKLFSRCYITVTLVIFVALCKTTQTPSNYLHTGSIF